MLPSPAGMGGMQMSWVTGQQNPSHMIPNQMNGRGHFQEALAGALQKFAAAEEVQKAAAGGSMGKGDSGRSQNFLPKYGAAEDIQLQQRLEAQAKAQATADRLRASGAAGASVEVRNESPDRGEALSEEQSRKDNILASLRAGASDKRFSGRVKSFSIVQGFGFIQSPEIHQLYGCDAFLNQAVIGGIVVGSQVTFSVEMKNGKPQARDVMLEEDSRRQPEKEFDAPGVQVPGPQAGSHRGRVKSFNAAKGFGFIASKDLQYQFGGRDIYVSRTQAPGGNLSVGSEVDFQLVLDQQGQPQARDITLVQAKRGPGMYGGGPSAGMPLFTT